MKNITFLYKSVLLVIALISCQGFSQNLLNNGDFETGGIVGFNINGAGYTQIFSPFSGTTSQGNFAITTNPQPMNIASFIASGDHTSGTGNMMIFDGNGAGGQPNFWEAGNGGGGVCGMTVGTTYTFSYWIRSVYGAVAGSPTPANIVVQILNANTVTLVSGTALAPLTANGWKQVVYTFVPTSNCVNIKLYNSNTNPDGNDFAVDDFSVTAPPPPLSLSNSSTNSTCTAANNGSIVGYANGGNGIYTFNLTGSATANNNNGIFMGLLPGTYSIQVVDGLGAQVTINNIIITEPSLTTSPTTTVCRGSSTTLTVSGGVSPYTWTANPADVSLVSPSNSPSVAPTQNTTYTVTSSSTSALTESKPKFPFEKPPL